MLDRATFLENRRRGVGGSDIAAILGLSPWKTPYDVYLDKRGEAEEEDPDKPALYWGTVLEDVVATEYAKRTGNRVQRVNKLLVHPEAPYAVANIDRAVVNPEIAGNVRWKDGRLTTDKVLECKTANGFAAHMWGDAGTDEVPDYYLLQCAWYMGITGAETADLAVLIGGQDYRTYTIERDQELIDDLLDEAGRFWERVEKGIAPDPQSVEDAQRRWPRHLAGKNLIVDTDIAEACARLAQISTERKALEAEEKEIKATVMAEMGDAEEITHAGQKLATWKHQVARRVDTKALKAERPDIAEEFTTETESRVFRLAKAAKEMAE